MMLCVTVRCERGVEELDYHSTLHSSECDGCNSCVDFDSHYL